MRGVGLALLAYSLLSCGDALVKGLGRTLGVFQIGFFATLVATMLVPLLKPRGQSWRDALRIRRFWVVEARALTGLGAGVLGIVAFTRLPLSEAYALIFLAPLFATLLAALVLRERVGWRRWLAIAIGFGGVLFVVQPGVRMPEWAHLAALGVALMTACSILLLRTVAAAESRVAVLGVMMGQACLFHLSALLLVGPGLALPESEQLARLAGAGMFGMLGQAALIAATRIAPASHVAPAQYCQLAWAVVIGSLFFGDRVNDWQLVGLGLIAVAGLLTLRGAPASRTST